MNKIIIYSKENCPFCTRAYQLLDRKNLSYTIIAIDEDPVLQEEMIKLVKEHMETVMKLSVPLKSSLKVGLNWMEMSAVGNEVKV